MSTTIFTNAYYQKKPLVQFSFSVDFIFHGKEVIADTLKKAIQSFKIPDMKINTITLNQFGFTYTRPARAQKHGSLSLSFNDNAQLNVRNMLASLFQQSFNNGFETSEFWTNAPYRDMSDKFEIIVNVYKLGEAGLEVSDEKAVAGKLHFTGCFIENVSSVDFDYSSQEVAKWTANVKFDNMYFEA